MPDIQHDFIIKAPAAKVFAGISSPKGLDSWWTKNAEGFPQLDGEYTLDFGPGYIWKAKVTKCENPHIFELLLIEAHEDWLGTRVGFNLAEKDGNCLVHFYHRGWLYDNTHYRGSCYCWAMYLRILKRNIEYGENVPYEQRLEV